MRGIWRCRRLRQHILLSLCFALAVVVVAIGIARETPAIFVILIPSKCFADMRYLHTFSYSLPVCLCVSFCVCVLVRISAKINCGQSASSPEIAPCHRPLPRPFCRTNIASGISIIAMSQLWFIDLAVCALRVWFECFVLIFLLLRTLLPLLLPCLVS